MNARFAALAALTAALGTHCSPTPRTEIVVRVDSDIPWGISGTLRSLRITVRSGAPDGTLRDLRTVELGDPSAQRNPLPATFGVVPAGGDTQRLAWIQVEGCGQSGCEASPPITVQRALVGFVPGQTLVLRMFLASACTSVRCDDPNQTCDVATQHCVSAHVDPTTLTAYSPDAGMDDGGIDAGLTDSGATDSSAMDSGATDSGITDSGGTDSGPMDSGATDSGATDSGSTDAGAPPRVVQLAAGRFHTCAVESDDSVWCWGANESGQVGTGAPNPGELIAVQARVTGPAWRVVAGITHSCAVLTDGTVECWGSNFSGESGQTPSPVAVAPTLVSIGPAIDVAAGRSVTCILRTDQTVECLGDNTHGELGRGSAVPPYDEHPATVPGLTSVVSLALGAGHACAARMDGSVWCWGENQRGQCGTGTMTQFEPTPVQVTGLGEVVQVAAAGSHTCARHLGGRVDCWGDNTGGALGDGTLSDRATFVTVMGIPAAVEISSSEDSGCARAADGSVRCWGNAATGELGAGSLTPPAMPIPIVNVASATGLASGGLHHCAIDGSGRAFCWGLNGHGELGNGTIDGLSTRGITLASLNGATALALGVGYTCGVLGGSVECVGTYVTPDLGEHSTAQIVPSISDATTLGAGSFSVCAVRASGANTTECWGHNDDEQLGDGTQTSRGTPAPVSGSPAYMQISANGGYACGRTFTGTVECWGANEHGQLGRGTASITPQGTPALVAGLPVVDRVHAGPTHACAHDNMGRMYCWGQGSEYQLGNGVPGDSATWVMVQSAGINTGMATTMESTAFTTCALAGGAVWCWGNAQHGALGDGTNTDHPLPTQVPGLSGITRICAGYHFYCALAGSGGPVSCWGDNSRGQIGQTGAASYPTPTLVTDLAGATSIACGADHVCAIKTDGSVVCLGDNSTSQLGVQGTVPHASPGPVVGLP